MTLMEKIALGLALLAGIALIVYNANLMMRIIRDQGKLYTNEPENPNGNPICIKCWADSLFDGDTDVPGERRYRCCNCGVRFHTRARHVE